MTLRFTLFVLWFFFGGTTAYAATIVKDYIIEYNDDGNIFKDWKEYREGSDIKEKFSQESHIIPFPFRKRYEDARAFFKEKQYLYDTRTPVKKLSGYRHQSILFRLRQTKYLKQEELVCITGGHLEIRKYKTKGKLDEERYRLSDKNVKNFYLVSAGSPEDPTSKTPLSEIHALYNVRKISYYNTPDCYDNNKKIRVNTFVYGGWGLSNYDLYDYSSEDLDDDFSYEERGILFVNGRVNEADFLKRVYDHYRVTVDLPFNPFGRELTSDDDGGLLYSLSPYTESAGMVFIKTMNVVEGKLEAVEYERICIEGPSEIYTSGLYSRKNLENLFEENVPYLYARDDIVFMVKTEYGYNLFYGIIPGIRYPRKYNNGFCG